VVTYLHSDSVKAGYFSKQIGHAAPGIGIGGIAKRLRLLEEVTVISSEMSEMRDLDIDPPNPKS